MRASEFREGGCGDTHRRGQMLGLLVYDLYVHPGFTSQRFYNSATACFHIAEVKCSMSVSRTNLVSVNSTNFPPSSFSPVAV